jgi:hypothetical protein
VPSGFSHYFTLEECEGEPDVCPDGFANCYDGGECDIDLSNDPDHCGQCGNSCPANNGTAHCEAGECAITCGEGYDDCNADPTDGCETNTWGSVTDCGGCGNVCSFLNAAEACIAGLCYWEYCDLGYAVCLGDGENGCEVNLLTDPNNCGNCNYVCLGPNPQCIGGSCGID